MHGNGTGIRVWVAFGLFGVLVGANAVYFGYVAWVATLPLVAVAALSWAGSTCPS